MAYKHRLDLTMGMPKGMNRMDQFPLDMSSVYYDYDAMVTYATTSAIAYVGQPLSLVDEINKVVTLYTIQDTEGTLKKVGTSPVGDESTIIVAEDGTVSLYGIAGLPLTREVEENGETITKKINYQPLLVDGKLTWIEPSATTVEGLATEIEGLKTRISTIENVVGKAAEGENEATGLIKLVADNTAAISTNSDAISDIVDSIGEVEDGKTVVEMIADAVYDDTTIKADIKANTDAIAILNGEATTVGSVKKTVADAIAEVIASAPEDFNTLKEMSDWIASHTNDATAMNNAIVTLQTIIDGIGDTENGEKATIVSYVDDAIAALAIGDYAKAADLTELAGRVEDLEEDTHTHDNADVLAGITADKVAAWDAAEANVISSVDETQFAITDEKLSLLDISMSKVTGLADALDLKADKTEIGSAPVYAEPDEDGNKEVITAGTGIYANVFTKEEVTDLVAKITGGESAADVLAQLTAYKTTNDSRVQTIEDKLATIEDNSDDNVIEIVKVNGVELEVGEDKSVDIKVATEDAAGVVVSSSAANKVSVAEDGTMEVNSLDVSKLSQTEELILNGGSSSLNNTANQ